MKNIFLLLICFLWFFKLSSQSYQINQTPEYDALIATYQSLSERSNMAQLISIGPSDFGKDIQLFILSQDGIFDAKKIKASGRGILWINNAIHAGESCGVDASLELAKKLCKPNSTLSDALQNLVVVLVPAYNVGGMHNRNAFSRVNQNGPEEHGFRGNAKNLDLNRDFIKCDSKNAASFSQAFQVWDPDFFIDTHTTNGSDHQYTLTLIASQPDKMNTELMPFLRKKVLPDLYRSMEQRGMPMTPYVYPLYESPDQGIKDFLEGPRFSSGYASLFSCFSFITEAHVYKPYSERVMYTLAFLEELISFQAENTDTILALRKEARAMEQGQAAFYLNWTLDSSKFKEIEFKGYEYEKNKSSLTGQSMGTYNKNKPFEKKIKYYNTYKPVDSVSKPSYYLIPQAYKQVLDRLTWNDVQFKEIESDSLIEVELYYIESFDSPSMPYEGHFLHSNIKLRKEIDRIAFFKGDILISTNQKNVRYLIECLEPESLDGFFAWNFFDSAMQQKEWFSSSSFEEKARKLLESDPNLKKDFDLKKSTDAEFASNHFAQLYFIYKRSPYYEKSAFRYPVFRII